MNFDKLVIKCIPDSQVALTSLKADSVQIYGDISSEIAKTISETEGLVVYQSKCINHVWEWEIGRHNQKALSDPYAVEAMFLCLDRNTIVNDVFNGMGNKAQSPFPSSAKYCETADPCEYNIEKARAVLAKSNYPDGFSFKATVASNTNEEYQTLIIWQSALKEIGIDLQIEAVDFSIWLDKYLSRSYDLICNDYSMVGTDPATYCNVILGDLRDYQTADLAELNVLIDDGASTNDDSVRSADYKAIQEILVKYRPVASYVETPSLCGTVDNLKRLEINGMGHCLFKGAYTSKYF